MRRGKNSSPRSRPFPRSNFGPKNGKNRHLPPTHFPLPTKTLHFASPRHLSSLFASREENLVHAERALGVKLVTRDDWLKIDAPPEPLARAEALFGFLDQARAQGMTIRTPDFHRIADAFARGEGTDLQAL